MDNSKTSYKSKYKWDKWFEKDIFALERGIDYDIGDGSMHQQVRNAAWHRGLKVSIDECSKGLIVKITERRSR